MGVNLLPSEVLAMIISRTSPRDASKSSLVSPAFKAAADSDLVWRTFLPSDLLPIIFQSVSPMFSLYSPSSSFLKELYFHLCCRPILVDGEKLSFSLERNTGKRCYMVGARGLSIIWSDSPEYWSWMPHPESRFSEVAELKVVCWLDIKGKIETSLLSPKTTYVAYFVFKFKGSMYGFNERAVELRVYLEGGDTGEGRMVFLDPPKSTPRLCKEREDRWMEIAMGEFFNDFGKDDTIVCSLMEVDDHTWKSGLVVEGIEFRPMINE